MVCVSSISSERICFHTRKLEKMKSKDIKALIKTIVAGFLFLSAIILLSCSSVSTSGNDSNDSDAQAVNNIQSPANPSVLVKIEYRDPDHYKAFPDDLKSLINTFEAQVRGSYKPTENLEGDIPHELLVIIEEALFNNATENLTFDSISFEIEIGEFYIEYGPLYSVNNDIEERNTKHIYRYTLNEKTYYLLVVDSGGSAGFMYISLYEEKEATLLRIGGFISMDPSARVFSFNNQMYYLERSCDYNFKCIDRVCITKLSSGIPRDFVVIQLVPEQYLWESIYSNETLNTATITDYVGSIKDELMSKSSVGSDIEVFIGDENDVFDSDKLLRLGSVEGFYSNYNRFFEIDFDNNGVNEYIDKAFWFPSNRLRLSLICNTYQFSDNQIASTSRSFEKQGFSLIQLWFKKIDGKVFTFKLYLVYGYNYVLNVSLIEGDSVTQVQSYIIVPEVTLIRRYS